MKLKFASLFVVFLVLAMVLSACGNTTAPEASSTEPVEIRWYIGLGTGTDPDQLAAEQEVVDAFNASHPDIHLVTE
ncbi:MAG: hypothetical protein ACYDH2_13970, partial [Anaerolineaceae bacterium]